MKRLFMLTGVLVLLAALLAACAGETGGFSLSGAPTATDVPPSATATEPPTLTSTPSSTPTATATLTPTPTATSTPSPTPLPVGYSPVTTNADWQPVLVEDGPKTLALVPAGCFEMGLTEEQLSAVDTLCLSTFFGGEAGGCDTLHSYLSSVLTPAYEVCFDTPFWIDAYEVSNHNYGAAGAYTGDDFPRESVAWDEAAAFCELRGGYLPTSTEWEYAARGPDNLLFSYGDSPISDGENTCDGWCSSSRTYASQIWPNYDYTSSDGYANTSPVGAFPTDVSWVGAFDMTGNVWEWSRSVFETGAQGPDAAVVDGVTAPEDVKMEVRGPGYIQDVREFTLAWRTGLAPSDRDARVGFRCAYDYQTFADLVPAP